MVEMISSSLEVVADVAATVMVGSPLNPPHQVPLDQLHHHYCYCCCWYVLPSPQSYRCCYDHLFEITLKKTTLTTTFDDVIHLLADDDDGCWGEESIHPATLVRTILSDLSDGVSTVTTLEVQNHQHHIVVADIDAYYLLAPLGHDVYRTVDDLHFVCWKQRRPSFHYLRCWDYADFWIWFGSLSFYCLERRS